MHVVGGGGDIMTTLEQNIDKTIAKMEAQLKLWNARLNELAARGKVTGQEIKIDARNRIDELKVAVDAAQVRLGEVKKAGAEQWENLRVAVEDAWKRAETAFKKLVD
jgi:hypothetical protein